MNIYTVHPAGLRNATRPMRAACSTAQRPRGVKSFRLAPCRAGVLEGFSGVSNLMAPEFATVFSAVIAITSVSINLYGGLITEKRRAELAREVEQERQQMAAEDEERSVVARYRGPLLEASVDLEARLYHIATLSGEWRSGEVVCEEEVVYTLFTLAQWLGFLEVVRREGPRERSFLLQKNSNGNGNGQLEQQQQQQQGGGLGAGLARLRAWAGGLRPGAQASAEQQLKRTQAGTESSLTTIHESFRFVLSSHPITLRKWYEQGDERDHPGSRSRLLMLRDSPAGRYMDRYAEDPYREPRPPTIVNTTSSSNSSSGSQGQAQGAGATAASSRGAPSQPAASVVVPPYETAVVAGVGLSAAPRAMDPWAAALMAAPPDTAPPPPTKAVLLSSLQQQSIRDAAELGAELVIGSLDENDLSGLDLGSLGSLGTLVGQPPGMGPRDVLLDARGPAAAAATAGVVEQREQPQQQPQPQPLVAGSQDVGAVQEADARVVVMDTTGGGASSRIGAAAAAAAGAAALGLGPGAGVMAQGPPPVLAMAHRDVFHVSRGTQRSIGSMMVVTPMGAKRHYTLSYGDFYHRYYTDEYFASWLRPIHTDILALVGGRRWTGQGPFPQNRWTRLLLLQQLLVETIELLDPAAVRVPRNRRVVLAPVRFRQPEELEAYKYRMQQLSQLGSFLLVGEEGGDGQDTGPFGALAGWWRRVVEGQGGDTQDSGAGDGSSSSSSSSGGEAQGVAGTGPQGQGEQEQGDGSGVAGDGGGEVGGSRSEGVPDGQEGPGDSGAVAGGVGVVVVATAGADVPLGAPRRQ